MPGGKGGMPDRNEEAGSEPSGKLLGSMGGSSSSSSESESSDAAFFSISNQIHRFHIGIHARRLSSHRSVRMSVGD